MMKKMKDSGVDWIGEIPEEWKLYPAKRFFHGVKRIVGNNADDFERLALTMRGVVKRSKDDNEGLQPEKFEGYQILRNHELVFKLIDLENVKTSRVGLSDYDGLVSPAYIVISNDKEDNRFYYYWFMFMYYNEVFNHLGGDGVRSSLNMRDLLSIPVPNIELKEQKKIANYLEEKSNDINNIIEKQEKIINELKQYKLSVITEVVTKGLNYNKKMKDSGIKWIGFVPKNWEVHKFCWDYSAALGKMLDAKKVTGEYLHPYIKNIDVQWGHINTQSLDEMDFKPDEIMRYELRPGDLMVCEGGEIGKCAIIPDDFPKGIYYQKALHRVRTRRDGNGEIRFLAYVLFAMAKNQCLDTSPEKATISHLPGDALSQLRIPTPPMKEQIEISNYLDEKITKIESIIVQKEALINKLLEFKRSLIYEVITGKKEI